MYKITVRFFIHLVVLFPIVTLAAGQTTWTQELPNPLARFHHIGLNSIDPAAAIDYYTSHFDCEKAKFNGIDAVRAQNTWLLFTKVNTPPKYEMVTSIWHIGWGAVDMHKAYQHLVGVGTEFWQGCTDLCDFLLDVPCGDGCSFVYIDGPDHAQIEVNTAKNDDFYHIHLHSMEPIKAGEWYMKNFGIVLPAGADGLPSSTKPRFGKNGLQVGPTSGFMMDNIRFAIHPIQQLMGWYPKYWREVDRVDFDSTEGYAIDHIAFNVDNLEHTLERLKKNGVTIIDDKPRYRDGMLSAFIEGPDHIRIELVEDR